MEKQTVAQKKIQIIIALLFAFQVVLFSCVKEEQDEFLGIIDPNSSDAPLAFLDEPVQNINAIQNSEEDKASFEFSNQYRNIHKWGNLQFSQEQSTIKEVSSNDVNNEILSVIHRSSRGEKSSSYYPIDTKIGPLTETKDLSFVEQKIYENIDRFFLLMQQGELNEKLPDLVLREEVPLISRQIERSAEYAQGIKEVRIGAIKISDTNERSVQVRVLKKSSTNDDGNSPAQDSRAKFQFYFLNVEGQWLINAIEGDFNALNIAYPPPGKFVPQGTTGVTQSF